MLELLMWRIANSSWAATGLFRQALAQLFSEVPIRAIEMIGVVLEGRASTEEENATREPSSKLQLKR